MIEKLRKELWELLDQIERRKSIEGELEKNHQIESAVWREEYQVRSHLNRLEGEMEELQKRSLKNMILGLRGQRELRLEQLEQEARLVEVELRDIQRKLEECGVKIKSLEATRQGFGDPERRFRDSYEKLKTMLKNEEHHGAEITQLEKAIYTLDKQLREIDQAIGSGGLALQEARNIQKTLRDARGLGVLDVAGGGVAVTAVKHKKINEARRQSDALRSRISQFNSELTDVNIGFHLGQDDVGSFLRFADFFLDGLLADWAVQMRIGDSQQEIAGVESSLRSMVTRLEQMSRTMQHERYKLKEQQKLLVLGTKPESAE